jgi:hypothetical protein
MLGSTLVTTRPARTASRSTASTSRKARRSTANSISRAGRPRDLARRLRRLDRRRHGHREVARTPGKDRHLLGRSGDRLHAASRPRVAKALGLTGAVSPSRPKGVLPKLYRPSRQGHEPPGDQSAGRHQNGRADLPRRQDRLRRQRALSPSRHRWRCAM